MWKEHYFRAYAQFLPHKTIQTIILDHHRFDQQSGTWKRKSSKPQPFLGVSISIHKEDYKQLGFNSKLSTQTKELYTSALADTGCQSCLVGMNIISKFGLKHDHLIPVTMKMHTANDNRINILGAIILRISGTNKSGKRVDTRQITYVTSDTDKLFLSKEACRLGMISNNFPAIGETTNYHITDTPKDITSPKASTTTRERECNCPTRTLPPALPTELPFDATDENREHLQRFLLEYYKASTFNTCEHQPLPLMNSPPLKLMVDPLAEHVAIHTPIPVPIYYQQQVKAGLDRDGVIESVPLNEPVTWCHRMVICAKKDGTPRCTIDLQALNAHALRETHHTQSPFHQARSIPAHTKKTVCDA